MAPTARRDGTPDRSQRSRGSKARRPKQGEGNAEHRRGGSGAKRAGASGGNAANQRAGGQHRRGGKPQSPARGSQRFAANGAKRGSSSRASARTNEQSAASASELIVSNAKPARKQHVDRDRTITPGEPIRLQKALAQAGVASRRHSEVLIEQRRVEVNGQVVTQQGTRVDPAVDVIRVDGVRVNVNDDHEYFVLNKPRGFQSTMSDELGRPCVGDIVSERVAAGQRLFHVGRLDAETEGLLLLTNDGELANRLMHPRYKVTKTYLATVHGEADPRLIRALQKGIDLEDGLAKADYAQIVDTHQGRSLVRVELHEGRKHIVRRMLKEAGFPVLRLVRTKLHTVQLGELTPGALRALNSSELTSLYKAVGM